MKNYYQILSYVFVILITLIIVFNIRFNKNTDYKNQIKTLKIQNKSLKANIDSNKVLINNLSLEIDTYKVKIIEDKKELTQLNNDLHKQIKNYKDITPIVFCTNNYEPYQLYYDKHLLLYNFNAETKLFNDYAAV